MEDKYKNDFLNRCRPICPDIKCMKPGGVGEEKLKSIMLDKERIQAKFECENCGHITILYFKDWKTEIDYSTVDIRFIGEMIQTKPSTAT